MPERGAPRRVVLSANSAWNIINFRAGLIGALKRHDYEPVVIAPAGVRTAELDVDWVALDIDRSGTNPFADVGLALNYRRILKRLQPVAYLGFTVKPNIYGSFAARSLGIPVIANISGLGTAFIRGGPLPALVSALYRVALAKAAAVFFQNPDDHLLFLERLLVRPDQAHLLPGSGVDLDRCSEAPLPEGPITFLFIGRLLGDKGVRELVAAARLMRDECPDVRIQLLGPLDQGNRTTVTRDELEQWVNDGVVEYLGETDDVRPFIATATAVVLPSYREGLPRALLEAGAMGRPLIASDVPGCREVVEDGLNGFTCEARDARSLAAAMKRFVELPSTERAAMGSAARRKIEARFSEAVVIRTYLDELGKIAGGRS